MRIKTRNTRKKKKKKGGANIFSLFLSLSLSLSPSHPRRGRLAVETHSPAWHKSGAFFSPPLQNPDLTAEISSRSRKDLGAFFFFFVSFL